MSSLSNFIGGKPYNTEIKYGGLKPSIVLFDCNPGTRSWTVPEGVIRVRAFVVGAGAGATSGAAGGGGGYSEKEISVTPGQVISYTVGAGGVNGTAGGTTSFGGVISATGGTVSAGGVGSGGDINRLGGAGGATTNTGGGASGHAMGDGQAGTANNGGGFTSGRSGFVDGWKIGVPPGASAPLGYGTGGFANTIFAGMGGGGGSTFPYTQGGVGGGAGIGTQSLGGSGLVGIEVIA